MIFKWFYAYHLGNNAKFHVIAYFKKGIPYTLCGHIISGSLRDGIGTERRCKKCLGVIKKMEQTLGLEDKN